jgi:ribosomal protein L37AE/L43A
MSKECVEDGQRSKIGPVIFLAAVTTGKQMHWSPQSRSRDSSEHCPACRSLVRSEAATAGLWWCGKCRVWWGFIVAGVMQLPAAGARASAVGTTSAPTSEGTDSAPRCS